MKTEMYRIVFSNDAKKDLKELNKKAPLARKKLSKLLEVIEVLVLSAFGHYKK